MRRFYTTPAGLEYPRGMRDDLVAVQPLVGVRKEASTPPAGSSTVVVTATQLQQQQQQQGYQRNTAPSSEPLSITSFRQMPFAAPGSAATRRTYSPFGKEGQNPGQLGQVQDSTIDGGSLSVAVAPGGSMAVAPGGSVGVPPGGSVGVAPGGGAGALPGSGGHIPCRRPWLQSPRVVAAGAISPPAAPNGQVAGVQPSVQGPSQEPPRSRAGLTECKPVGSVRKLVNFWTAGTAATQEPPSISPTTPTKPVTMYQKSR